jgi:hypothetical protein
MNTRVGRALFGVAVAIGLEACATIRSSSVPLAGPLPAADVAAVRVTALDAPPQARELGMVQVHGASTTIEALIGRFVQGVARLGGDLAKIDSIDTRFEAHEQEQTVGYDCGTEQAPQTCSRTESVTIEVPTTRVLGRAFSSRRTP